MRFLHAAWAALLTLCAFCPGSIAAGKQAVDINIRIQADGGVRTSSPQPTMKADYGHYFATRPDDLPADGAMLCEQPGVIGIDKRFPWSELEPTDSDYGETDAWDFSEVDEWLAAIAASDNPDCQLWIFPLFKGFQQGNDPENPNPTWLRASDTSNGWAANNQNGQTAKMYDSAVLAEYIELMREIARRYDSHPNVQGFTVQESSMGYTGTPTGYTGTGLTANYVTLVQQCALAFVRSRCMFFMNFISGNQAGLNTISDAMIPSTYPVGTSPALLAALAGNKVVYSGPDILPGNNTLYLNGNTSRVYEVLMRHAGARANSAQNDSFEEEGPNNNAGVYCPEPGSADFPSHLSGSVTGATNATPIVITSTNHQLQNNWSVRISGVNGNTAANGTFIVASRTANTFALTTSAGANVAGNGAYTSGGTWQGGNGLPDCSVEDIFLFAVGDGTGSFGDFNHTSPYNSGLCINTYIFWNHYIGPSEITGQTWESALPVIADHPYSTWLANCPTGNAP